ncbi:HhoA/HhoB/HtrA family serine endopeptidase [Synechococcus sp. PCC 6312]|uniref:HhoA/HhoB/HtrA family serine endopeptidase n=1 Tax=Synechococcus sp. (strain ATCC 27167 / PCC 6312) TaxID=195253 RepID=UPI00029F2DD3|nr:HhoA/HhoB/HtrA family serine endopeptidase [Synechococcus sp. PCC 6312]AFY60278.1 trypsin-like serine protease with C-terminal PDZ domain [Synechococcus sp. PCC 6312]
MVIPKLSHLLRWSGWIVLPILVSICWLGLGGNLVWAEPEVPIPHSFVAEAVARVGPAVVRIDTERTVTRTVDPFFSDPLFRQFFPGLGQLPPQEDRQRGQGSGFIIDASGIVLTNAHVVSDADTVNVTLKDGHIFAGEVRGADPVSDLAVVKLKGVKGELPVAPLGNSQDVLVGDWAIAVGNPLGLDNTVTLGIVSTLHRSSAQVGIPDKRLDFIQTDAAINPGNSGGPLLNQAGEVIGINTAIRADAMGIGFAIPIDKAKSLKDRLVRGDKIKHAYIGIQMTNLTPSLAAENNRNPNSPVMLPEVEGVLVVQVFANTPAAGAGLRWGDVITAVDGETITSADQLQGLVDQADVGQQLSLKIRRGEQIKQIAIRTGELPGTA